MKNIYKILLSGFFLLIVGYSGVYGQTATTTVYFSGFQACGGCTVCGSDYWCTNTPGSYCGDTPPCKTLSFTDPVPAGHVVTSVTANYYTGSCEGASFTSSINGFSLPIAYDGATGCWCDDLPCMMTTSVTGNFPCGLPGYIYGGSNSFNLCSSGPMCINRAELIFTYVDPDVITPSITASGPLSFCMPGSVTLDAGTGYSAYHWNTGSTSQTIVATTAGVYTVTVTSTTGCTSGSSSVTVTAAPNVTPTFTQLGPYCKGQIPGVLPTTSLNGITGTWSPSTINTNNFGTTVHTFTPNAGQCAITTTMTVVVSPNTTPTFTQLGPYCAGQTPGTLPTTSTNSVAGTWSPATVNTSTPGTFTHTFTPNSGQCAEIVTMDIVVYANPTANATIHGNPSCNGSSDGSIVLNVSGGTSPYTFSWSNGASSQDLFDIPAGTYSVLVTDAHGCTASSSASLVEPNPIVASVGSVTPSICNTPGSATVSATGGTPPYTFTWPASAGGYVGPTHSSLSSGTYVVTASDQYGCSSSATVTVPQTGSVSASVGSITNVSCYGANNGSVQVNITAGTPDFTISWGSGSISTNLTSYTFTNLPAGTFGLTITDANGCVTSLSGITISEPPALVVQLNSITHVTCNGGSNGSASIGVTGGTPPYSYAWTPSTLSGANPTGLSAGNYSVTVSDAHNCTGTISFTIQETSDFVIVKDRENAPCYGETGSATISVLSGGTPPYSILWSNGSSQFTNGSIPANTPTGFTVTDSQGCSFADTVIITQPDLLTTSISGTDALCGGSNTGSATITVTGGGTPPYFYHWSNNSVNPTINYLVAGTYSVTVTDFNGCSSVQSITITDPDDLLLSIAGTPIACGVSAGSATATASGGIPPYTFHWSNGDQGPNATNLSDGIYYCTVTDNNSCTATSSVNIGITGVLNPLITVVQNITCNGAANGILSADITAAQPPYSFHWSNNSNQPIISNLQPGNYIVTVYDDWGCTGTATGIITEPPAITINAVIQDIRCTGVSDGSISVTVTGGTPDYIVEWSNGSHDYTISNLSAGTYSVVIKDSNSCQRTQSFVINEPTSGVNVSAAVTDVSCFGGSDGSIAMFATGGTLPYSFSCSNANFEINQQLVANLPAGTYIISVVDDYGCVDDSTVMIIEPSVIIASFVSTDPSCTGNNDGSIDLNASGGTEPYVYNWLGVNYNLPYFNGLLEGEYYFTIIDNRGCELSLGPIILTDNPINCIRIPNAFSPNNDGVNDTWEIENLHMFPEAVVQVFNRWGQELYNNTIQEGDWDGYYNGKLLPTGVYLYVIVLFNGTDPYTGAVTLVK